VLPLHHIRRPNLSWDSNPDPLFHRKIICSC